MSTTKAIDVSLNKIHRSIIIVFCYLIFMVLSLISAPNAFAQVNTQSLSTDSQASAFAYFKALRVCQEGGWMENSNPTPLNIVAGNAFSTSVSQEMTENFQWYDGSYIPGFPLPNTPQPYLTHVGIINKSDFDSSARCGDDEGKSWLKKAASFFGYSSGRKMACDIGFTREKLIGLTDCSDESPGDDDFIAPSDGGKHVDDFWTNKLGNSSVGIDSITPKGGAYALYYNSFILGCKPHEVASWENDKDITNSSGKRVIKSSTYTGLRIYDKNTGKWMFKTYSESSARGYGPDKSVTVWEQHSMSCLDIAKQLMCKDTEVDNCTDNKVLSGMIAYLQENKDGVETNQCEIEPNLPECQSSTPKTSCAVDGIGWLVCPVMSFLGGVTDAAFNFLADSFLKTNVALVSQQNASYTAWQFMRGFANVAFIIVFLIIIFSQLTSIGVSNYGVKKMLPRLVVAAILVNVSFYVCQLAVDVSNITGYSIKDLFDGLGQYTQTPDINGTNDASGNGWGITTAIAAALVAGSLLLLAVSFPVILAALLALFLIILILIGRQALIVILIVISPLAFVAYLLPNTEQWFKKWWKMFAALLLVFPTIALVFGGSNLAAKIIKASSDEPIMQFVALGVAVVPLFLVPSLLKGALNAAGEIGAKMSKLSSGAGKLTGGLAKKRLGESRGAQFLKYRSDQSAQNRALRRAGIGGKFNPIAATNRGLNKISGKFGSRLAASGAGLEEKRTDEQTAAATALISSKVSRGETTAEKALQEALQKGDHIQARAAQNLLFNQGASGIESFRKTVSEAESSGKANPKVFQSLRRNLTQNHGQFINSKAKDVMMWAAKNQTMSDATSDPTTWSSLSPEAMAEQSPEALKRAADAGLLNGRVAREALDNENINTKLNPEQRNILNRVP